MANLAYDEKDLWILDERDLEALEVGAAILGTGGGGNPYIGKLRTREAIRAGFKLSILPLDRISDDAKVVALGGIGSPLVAHERIKDGAEGLRCIRALEERLDIKIDAIACEEIGGANSMEPLIAAAQAGLPVLDGDGMGRAFPEMQMTTYSIYGHRSTPSVMCDLHGNTVFFDHAVSEIFHEKMARAVCVVQGGASTLAGAPMSGDFAKRFSIPNAYTNAVALGHAVLDAQKSHSDPIAAILAKQGGKRVFDGKIGDLKRFARGGFTMGEATLSGLDKYSGDAATIMIQNENLIFTRNGVVEVVVPDLIIVLDIDTGTAITTEMLRYGQRVAVIALPCHALLKTPQALEVVGPKAFGFHDVPFYPMAEVA
jgi:DUF917 family protein